MNRIFDLVGNFDFSALVKGEKAIDRVGSAAKGAQQELDKVDDTLSGFGALGGPVGEVASKIEDLKKRSTDALKSIKSLTVGLGSMAAAGAILVGSLFSVIGAAGIIGALRFTSTLDELTKLGEELGYSASQVALLDAKLQGRGGLAGYEKDIEKVTKALGRADEEGNKAYTALETLGINAAKANDPLKVLADLTEKYGDKVKTGNLSIEEQAALQLVLGNSWKETIFRQKEAASALEMYTEFEKQKIGISKAGEQATADYNDAMDGLSYVFKVVGSQLVAVVVPAFTGLVGALVDSYKNGGLVKIAFDTVRGAANLLMVPIRALFNIFIQLDAAVQSVGKSLGALFAAIATRSLNPFAEAGRDIQKIWETANSRTVGMFGSDNQGIVEAPTKGNRPPDKKPPPKDPKDTKDKKVNTGTFVSSGRGWEEEMNDFLEAQERIKRKYMDMVDPLNKYTEMLKQIRDLRAMGIIDAETQLDMEMEVETQRQAAMDKTIDKMNEVSKVGDLVFQSVSQAFSNMVQGSNTSFREMASGFAKSLLDMFIQAKIMIPMFKMLKQLTGWSWISIPGVASANGNVFGKTGLLASANGNAFGGNGSVLTGPTLHSYKGGLGIAGEAGDEAVMPLTRIGGKLGVLSTGSKGGGNVYNVTVNVQGGKDSKETGDTVSASVMNALKGMVKQEIALDKRNAAYAV